MHGDVFGPVPDAGRWRTALLLDGNLGIGGDPVALLRRVAALLATERHASWSRPTRPGPAWRRAAVRLDDGRLLSEPFPWARVGIDALAGVARAAGLGVAASWDDDGRWFAQLGAMRLLPATPPPGPARPEFWRSPLRGARLTTILGLTLLVGITIVAVTGFLSHAAYQPDLGRNAQVPRGQDLQLLVIGWPTSPSWLYALTQGLHVTIGIVAVPVLLAKLWSVIPRLFAWPPVASAAQGAGAAVGAGARRQHAVPVRHRDHQRRALLPVALQVRAPRTTTAHG